MDYFVNGTLDRAGVQTDKLARQYASDHKVSYSEGLKAVIKEGNREHAQKINRGLARYDQEGGTPGGWRVFQENGNILEVQLENAGQGISKLSSVIAGLPKLADGSVDIALALRVIRSEFSDLAKDASGGYLHHQAMRILGRSHPDQGMDLMSAMRQAQQEFPAVAATYNGSALTEESLRTICFPLFRTTVPPPAPGERSYERATNKLYYPGWKAERPSGRSYVNGDEYRTYEYSPTQK